MRPRRQLLGLLGLTAMGGLAGLAGCGFELRRTPTMPFSRIALTGFATKSALALALRERLAPGVQVVDTPGQAELVLQALLDRREKSVVATTAVGQVRELQLRIRFGFRLVTPGGRELAPAAELFLSRDLSYNETYALAKAQEEADIYAAMQADIVQQVLSRLAQVDLARSANPPRG
jgi:LPS-assembly lipoprotein